MAKLTISIKVNYDYWKKAKGSRLNISKICDDAIKQAVNKKR